MFHYGGVTGFGGSMRQKGIIRNSRTQRMRHGIGGCGNKAVHQHGNAAFRRAQHHSGQHHDFIAAKSRSHPENIPIGNDIPMQFQGLTNYPGLVPYPG